MLGEVKDLAAGELRLLLPIIGLWIKSVDGSTKSSEGKDHLEVYHQFLILENSPKEETYVSYCSGFPLLIINVGNHVSQYLAESETNMVIGRARGPTISK